MKRRDKDATTEAPPSPATIGLSPAPTAVGSKLPELTTALRDAMPSPAPGMMIFNPTTKKMNFYDGTQWCAVTSTP